MRSVTRTQLSAVFNKFRAEIGQDRDLSSQSLTPQICHSPPFTGRKQSNHPYRVQDSQAGDDWSREGAGAAQGWRECE
jgi:hypothetical protein